jgi:ABC-type antimicrobial peptide transport system permease subunit
MVLYARAERDAASLLVPLQREIRQIDPNVPIQNAQLVREVIDQSLWAVRLGAGLLAVFGALALTLVCVGLYGVMAYSVGQRTREIGLRMALGADRRHVLGLVLRQGLMLVGAGVVLGVAGALAVARLIQSLLFGSAYDLPSFLGASAILILVAAVASFLPARRASLVDPLTALREI